MNDNATIKRLHRTIVCMVKKPDLFISSAYRLFHDNPDYAAMLNVTKGEGEYTCELFFGFLIVKAF
jgi:hypothetical protein